MGIEAKELVKRSDIRTMKKDIWELKKASIFTKKISQTLPQTDTKVEILKSQEIKQVPPLTTKKPDEIIKKEIPIKEEKSTTIKVPANENKLTTIPTTEIKPKQKSGFFSAFTFFKKDSVKPTTALVSKNENIPVTPKNTTNDSIKITGSALQKASEVEIKIQPTNIQESNQPIIVAKQDKTTTISPNPETSLKKDPYLEELPPNIEEKQAPVKNELAPNIESINNKTALTNSEKRKTFIEEVENWVTSNNKN